MTFEQRKQERQALVQHLMTQDWDVFGTLKFVNGRTIGRKTANTLLRSYWNKIDRVFLSFVSPFVSTLGFELAVAVMSALGS